MRVRFTKLANEDLQQAYLYIVQESPESARDIIERIKKAINTLCQYSSLGKPGRIKGTREFVVSNTPFILVYRQKQGTLQILSVLHTSKKYPYRVDGIA